MQKVAVTSMEPTVNTSLVAEKSRLQLLISRMEHM